MNGILITGGAGNLACQLTFRLPSDAPVHLADLAPGPVAEVRADSRYSSMDLTSGTDLDALLAREKPCAVLHFASLLSGSTEADRMRGWEVNVNTSLRLFESCLRHGVRTVVFPSSLAVHGGVIPDPLPEQEAEWPDGLYGVTKIAVERLGTYYHRKHGLDFRCVRLPVIVSPHAPPGAASAYASRVFVECAHEARYTFRVPPDLRVSTMYVEDSLTAFVQLLAAEEKRLTRRVYSLHSLSPSVRDLAEAVLARIPGAKIDFDPDPAISALLGGWPAVIEDASARADWGWSPAWDLERLADDMIHRLKTP